MFLIIACIIIVTIFLPFAVLPSVLEAVYSPEELARMGVQTVHSHS